EPPADVRIHCPKGSPIRYGEVVNRGDGFDEGANAFREMPPLRSVVAFEENPEEVEGHYFYIGGEEHRVIRLDAASLSVPLEGPASHGPRPRRGLPDEAGARQAARRDRSRRGRRAHPRPGPHPERPSARRPRPQRGGRGSG